MSVEHRTQLRNGFSAYTDMEYTKLMQMVEDKEAEIASLYRREKSLKQALESTRSATMRRSNRLGTAASVSHTYAGSEGSSTSAEDRVKREDSGNHGGRSPASPTSTQEQYARDSVFGPRRTAGHGARGLFGEAPAAAIDETPMNQNEEYLELMVQQVDLESGLKLQYEEACKKYKSMIVSRRIMEASLMGTHAQVLQLRSRVMKNESRTTLLANELRSVLQKMPESIESTLARIYKARREQRQQEVEDLKTKYQDQAYKFMQEDVLIEKCEEKAEDASVIQEACEEAQNCVRSVKNDVGLLLKVTDDIDEALMAVQNAWMLVPMLVPTDRMRDRGDIALSDDGQMLVSKAFAAGKSLRELLQQLHDSSL